MKTILLRITIISLPFLISCKGTISEPEIIPGLDTTSHNFDWQFDTIGIRQSYLRDVSIISPDDIWAVGEINTNDTGIPDSNGVIIRAYNAIHWNGTKWELYRLKTARYDGPLGEDQINCLYCFSTDDIWMFSDVGSYLHWDGSNWRTEFLWERQGGVYTIWGFSSDDLYFAGTNGSLTHYDGTSFTLLPTNTDLRIEDIYGTINASTHEKEILYIVSTPIPPPGRGIFRLEGTQSEPENADSLPNLLSTIWFDNKIKYYVGGDGLWSVNKLGQSWRREEGLLNYFEHDMLGQNSNDIFIVGAFGFIAHYNGANWHNYNGSELPFLDGVFARVDYKENLIVTVGLSGTNAVILRGIRQ